MDKQQQIYENMKQIIEVSQQRGCWKASEMKDIGITYESILQKLTEVNDLVNTPNTPELEENNNTS
jgi:hypothetical protein